MAYDEYLDLYLNAQNNENSLYYVVSFDVINSKSLNDEQRKQLQININIITKYVYNKLLDSEIALNKQVVINDDRFIRPWDLNRTQINGNYIDPFIIGDCFQFTVIRDTVSKEKIVEWVNECKISLNMQEEFHVNDGYYETNNYEEGGNKFYRSYCLQTLESLHKSEIQDELKRIRK